MKPYMFVINAIPMPTNKSCEEIAKAKVHIWVMSTDKEEAKKRALEDIASYHWKVTSVEYEFEIQQEQIPQLHAAESRLYQKALQNGLAADYIAYPKQQGQPDDPVRIQKLEHP